MLAHDKILHMMGGCIIALVLMPISPQAAFFGAVFAGLGKEILDRVSGKGTPDAWDAVATIGAGAVTVWINELGLGM